MSNDKSSDESSSLVKRQNDTEVIRLADVLNDLPEDQKVALQVKLTEGLIEANTKAAVAGTEARALKENLRTVSDAAIETANAGASVTLSHVQETEGFKSSGGARTEMIAGNTERAESGKLTKTQSGEKDWTPFYIFGGLAAAVLVAIAIANNL